MAQIDGSIPALRHADEVQLLRNLCQRPVTVRAHLEVIDRRRPWGEIPSRTDDLQNLPMPRMGSGGVDRPRESP